MRLRSLCEWINLPALFVTFAIEHSYWAEARQWHRLQFALLKNNTWLVSALQAMEAGAEVTGNVISQDIVRMSSSVDILQIKSNPQHVFGLSLLLGLLAAQLIDLTETVFLAVALRLLGLLNLGNFEAQCRLKLIHIWL